MTAGLNLIQQAISIYDDNLRLAVCNARFKEMFGLPDKLVTSGARFSETIRHLAEQGEYGAVEDLDQFVRDREQQARAFEPHYMERTRANGRTISVEGSPLPKGGWVTVYTDITRTRRQEGLLRAKSAELSGQLIEYSEELAATNRELQSTIAALEEAKRELTEIEARTRLTTEMMPAHIAHVNAERRYTYSNRRLSSIMPNRPSDIIGRHISEALGAQAHAQIEPYLDDAFRGLASVFEFTDELSQRRIRVAFTPDKTGEAPIQGAYILSMDVTQETQARAALQQTRRREMGAQMVSGLAHDFSNLLTIILGMQTKLATMDVPADGVALIEATLSAARRGGTLLNQIADMTGAREIKPRPVDLDTFLSDLYVLAEPSLPTGVSLSIKNDIGAQSLLLDAGSLQDSLLNLILNARDACGNSGVIKLRARTVRDTWVEFTVSDSGPGFSNEALTKAMDPFFTTKGADGSGLGLPMVYDMTKLAGGEVRIANAYGGARVTLRLPYRAADIATPPSLVLLVEDNPDLRIAVRDMLTDLGHSVVEATSVPEARALVDGLPDIAFVLSDIQLEGLQTGLDLIDPLFNLGKPIYLMTSLPQGHSLRIQATARVPVLAKPFTAHDLSQLLYVKAT